MKSARQALSGMRARARVGILVEGASCLAAACVAHGLISYGLDRWLHLESGFRAVLLLGLAVALWQIIARRLTAPLRAALDDEELALAVERRDPDLRQALISAIEFDADLGEGRDHGESPAMMRTVIDDVERRTAAMPFVRALDRRRVARYLALLAGSVALAAGWLSFGGDEARIWMRRDLLLGDVDWPRDTWLAWDEVDASAPLRIAEREDLRLRVAVTGVVPEQLEIRGRFAGGQSFSRPMDRVGVDRFAVTLETLLEDVDVYAVGGDGETPPLAIRLVPRPRVNELSIRVDFPEYMRRDSEELAATGGDVRIPRGARLTLAASCSKPLASATLVLGPDARLPVEIIGPQARQARVEFVPATGGELRLDLLDIDDLGPVAAPMLHLRILDDEAPTLQFETRGIGTSITPNARIPGVLRLRDDYGIAAVSASFRTVATTLPSDGEQPPEPEFEPASVTWQNELEVGATEADLGLVFDLLPLLADPDPSSAANRIQAGTLLSLRFGSLDVRAPDANRGESEVLNLRVVTRDELIEDLTRRQLEQRRELERVLQIEVEARAELSDIVSPTSGDPRAVSARLRIDNLARQQLAQAKKVQGIAERYERIVDEMANNRLFEPAITRSLGDRIVAPLGLCAGQDLPRSAALVTAFAEAGDEDARASCIAAYDDLIARIRALLAQMERTESLAALVDSLRGIIRTEREVDALLERLRAEQGEGIFGPEHPPEDAPRSGDRPGDAPKDRENR